MPGPAILLDGAMGTELSRRGFASRSPLHSAQALLEAPELVEAIHADYIRAGAQVITTNTVGLYLRNLAAASASSLQSELVARAVEGVRRARWGCARLDPRARAGWGQCRIAGSLPCLRGGPSEDGALIVAEQRQLAHALVEAGVDLLLLETYTSLAELRHGLAAVEGLAVPVWVALVAGAPTLGRPDGTRLVGGEPLADAIQLVDAAEVGALLINCTQIDAVPAALRVLDGARTRPLGLYPHLGRHTWDGRWVERIVEPEVYAGQLVAWRESHPSLDLLGACCGSTPDYIAALRERFQPDQQAREQAFSRLAELVP